MYKLVLFLLLSSISGFAFCQQNLQGTWHLTIADGVTTKGIEKANVTINGKKYFTTNVNGSVSIDKNLIQNNGVLNISVIGYKPVSLTPGVDFRFPDTIRLSPEVTTLAEVKIGPPAPVIVIGDVKKSYNSHRTTNPGEALAQFIPNGKKIKGTITAVTYVLNDEVQGIAMPFRVRLFTKNKNNLALDKELIKDSLIIYNKERQRQVTVDISKYNIRLPQSGIIVVFEILPASYYGKDSVLYDGQKRLKTPGIDMDLSKKNEYQAGIYDKENRTGLYCMVGPPADKWNFDNMHNQWYAYPSGNNFAITATITIN